MYTMHNKLQMQTWEGEVEVVIVRYSRVEVEKSNSRSSNVGIKRAEMQQ